MALVRDEIARCHRCNKYQMMTHINHKQSQKYCKLCEPIMEQEKVNAAIEVLIRNGVTPAAYTRFYKNYVQKDRP